MGTTYNVEIGDIFRYFYVPDVWFIRISHEEQIVIAKFTDRYKNSDHIGEIQKYGEHRQNMRIA